ncbi:GGDEF domain-containing protein [Gellertiella hungarica]|uniref:diguanylate cyclase n=1 Tax=Gellertiella hungarica TaxID=1572859 RepID=A0A7W6J738_9HYPH|nr:GGDEF domain-containing protein [Gellertiella hungarica]MBB4066026.1 diguanylate cyclase (GGDEF)-like protein [Gellertiella hungarica]
MDASTIIFYLPVTIYTVIALVFLLLWRMGLSSSWQWAAGFAQTGAGFALSAFPIDPVFDEFVSGIIYTGAAYCYGGALLVHFGQQRLRRIRRTLALGFMVPHVYFVFINESLRWDLFAIEMVFAALLSVALWAVRREARNTADRAFMIASWLVVFDCLSRGLFFTFVDRSSDSLSDFLHSAYNLEVHVSTITLCLFFPFSAITAMLARVADQHRRAALTDPLTGLLNRRGLEGVMGSIADAGEAPGAVIVCDIDHFKRINDRYGHGVGDRVIMDVARILVSQRDGRSHIARVGGEEFILLVPGVTTGEAVEIAEGARRAIEVADWGATGMPDGVTASFGVAAIGSGVPGLGAAIDRADEALYRAKNAGRNRVVCAGSPGSGSSAATDGVADVAVLAR